MIRIQNLLYNNIFKLEKVKSRKNIKIINLKDIYFLLKVKKLICEIKVKIRLEKYNVIFLKQIKRK